MAYNTKDHSFSDFTATSHILSAGYNHSPPRASPAASPSKAALLAARGLGIVLSLALIGLAAATIQDINRPKWSAPIFTPAFTSFFTNGKEILTICRQHRYTYCKWRLSYDAVQSVGFGIALGYLVTFTKDDLLRKIASSSQAMAGIAAAILCGMAAEMVLHFAIGVNGLVTLLKLRQNNQRGGDSLDPATP